LSIGYANICSSVKDHRQKFEIILRFWKNKIKKTKGINKKEA